ncbi:hypothetical protein, partial [Tahibacter sp.]|uniref:hypothetical protein n=1 Tax=Tahibacter sp. TaxID=2056211 RepID=UPI0028C4F292
FMQDLPASDRVEIILRTAVFCVLALPARPPRLLAPLLRHWVGLQNAEHDFYRALSIVVAAAPEACIQAIEDDASEDEFVGDAAPDLCTALVGRRDKPKVEAALAMAAREWLRSYSAEHFSEIGRLGFEGLVASPVIWVETLVDYAAKFLAALSHAHWPLSLGYWARCRLAHTAAREEAYAYDEDMRYLGAAMGLTDAIAAEVLAVASSQTNPKLTDEEVDLVSRLLNGQVYAELSLRYTQELAPKRPPEIELQVREKFAAGPRPDTFDYSELYRDESATGSEPWLHVESTILETAPNRLAAIVQDLARQALDAAAAARAGGLAHFVRDHALLLGVIAVELVHVHSRKPGTDNQIGRACGGLFAAIAPERQFAALTGVSDLANIKRLDVTGISASIPKSVLNEAARGQLDDPARAFALALVLAEGSGPMVLEEGQIVSKLLRHKHDSVRNMIPRLIRRRGNVADAKIVTLYYPTIAGCHSKTAKEVSTLLLRGAWPPRYSDLRFRLRPNDWPAAAHMDGSGAAIALFVTDLHGLLRSVLGDAWPHAAPSDFATLAAYAPYGSRTAGMTLDLPAAREAVRLLTSSAPAALTAIRKGLEGLAPNTLARADQHLRLATALALQGPMKEAARWFNRLLANDHAVADHKGLSVERPKVMLFKDDRPEIVALRNELAARAWTDHDILQLVCLAQLEGRDAWLDEWIAREAQQPERCRRVRGILLRGWRADDDDLAWLADLAAPTGFEAFAADTALAWARRRRRLHEEMLRFMKAGSEADAWLASRWMAHLGDRRVLVEARRLRWPGVLSPQRRAAFEQSKANFERQFLMLEGNLKQKFAGVTPPTFAPWSEVMIYNSPA